MDTDIQLPIKVYDFEPVVADILQEVLAGLTSTPKYLPAKFNYDEQGAKLYEKICTTEDYYLTRTEHAIMHQCMNQIIDCFKEEILLIEYGSGSGEKTEILLKNLPNISSYIPIDISKQQLIEFSTKLLNEYPTLEILPVCADYMKEFEMPKPTKKFNRQLIYYPGSTIGNISQEEATMFLSQLRQVSNAGDALLISVDLQKDPAILTKAYHDSDGYSEKFNLINALERLNGELNTDFVRSQFQHYVKYNQAISAVEIFIKSLCKQKVHIEDTEINFNTDELIKRGVSYKYTLDSFQKLASQAGWEIKQVWTDDKQWFSVNYFIAK